MEYEEIKQIILALPVNVNAPKLLEAVESYGKQQYNAALEDASGLFTKSEEKQEIFNLKKH